MKQYEMHMHTKYSRCSNLELQSILKIAGKKKVDGVAITDHDTFIGAQKLFQLNKDKNFEVIRGMELSTKYGHLLAYYLQKEIKSRNFLEIVDEIKEQDAVLVHAHPFDFLREYAPKGFLKANYKHFNALEVLNARAIVPWSNMQAKQFALKHQMTQIGGSDAHFLMEIGRVRTCFEEDFKKALKKKQISIKGHQIYSPIGHALTLVKKLY